MGLLYPATSQTPVPAQLIADGRLATLQQLDKLCLPIFGFLQADRSERVALTNWIHQEFQLMDEKRILVLTTDAFGSFGGIALYNRDVITAICEIPECTEVVAIPRFISGELENDIPDKLTYITNGLNSKLNYIKAVFGVLLKHSKFALIVCGHINLLPVAYLVGLLTRKPVILFVYGVDVWQAPKSGITHALLKRISLCISISEVTRKKMLKWSSLNPEKIVLLPNAIHLTKYGAGDKKITLLDKYGLKDQKVVMTLGRMSADERYKGFDEIIDILPELVRIHHDVVYLVVGDGTDRQRLEQKASALGMENHVVFTGFVPESEKADHIRLADAYVMPSYGEGFGFVFLEALACEIPVVASNVDGGREAVREGMLGALVNPHDPEELKRAILHVLEQPKGIPQGIEYFSYPNFKKRLQKIINSVVGEKPK